MDKKKIGGKGINSLVFAGVFIVANFTALLLLPALNVSYIPIFLAFFLLASGGYTIALFRLKHDRLSVTMIWGFAIIFRLLILFTQPSLSDDVYRYVWDGHLLNNGINPYALPVNSPLLDAFDIPLRSLVNHNWMASPYFPVSQFIFAVVEFIFPQSILAFQMITVAFDLMAGWIALKILRLVGLPERNILVYLWNPLIIIEFSHGAHMDAIMIFFVMLAFWFLIRESQQFQLYSLGSAITLAAATLTKILPILLVPIFWWGWDWKKRLVFGTILFVVLGLFIPGAGLGLIGPLDGTGIFGAFRIYIQQWNYNSGIYHWLEGWISGYASPGAAPIAIVGQTPIFLTKTIVGLLFGLALLLSGWLAWRNEKSIQRTLADRNLYQLRLAMLPFAAYLLFTTTIHPWYVTLIIPFMPFFYPADTDPPGMKSAFWSGIYFSLAVTLSYLTYLDPDNLREIRWVRLVEYIPLYGLLIWAFLRVIITNMKIRLLTT